MLKKLLTLSLHLPIMMEISCICTDMENVIMSIRSFATAAYYYFYFGFIYFLDKAWLSMLQNGYN